MHRLFLLAAAGLILAGSAGRTETAIPTPAVDAANRLDRLVDSRSFNGGLGVNIHFDGHRPREVADIARAGFRLVRSDLLWAHVERARGQYDWQQYDSLVADLHANNLVPLMILAYSNPLYAIGSTKHPGSDSQGYQAPIQGEARAAYMAFVRAAARRYGTQVIWEIWNEPDQNFGDPIDLRSFIGFALEACGSVRSVAPDAPVIGPAASGFVWWFLATLRKADGDGCLDAISVHPYRDEPPESVLHDWTRAHGMLADCAPGSHCPALVDSEWGYSVTGGVWTAQRQADFVSRVRLLDMLAGVRLTIIYDWRNDGPDPLDKEANFGLLTFAGVPKPAFHVLTGIGGALDGLRYTGPAQTRVSGDFALSFGRDGDVRKVVAWSAANHPGSLQLTDTVCHQNGILVAVCGAASVNDRRVNLSATPTVFDLDHGPYSERNIHHD